MGAMMRRVGGIRNEEIVLKSMAVELIFVKANLAKEALNRIDLELKRRVQVEEIEVAALETSATNEIAFSTARSAGTSKKAELELSILKTLRQSPNGFKRLRGYRKLFENGKLQQRHKRLFEMQSNFLIGRRLRLAG
jgi:hypothetical protein